MKINPFMAGIAVLQAAAAIWYATHGNPTLALLNLFWFCGDVVMTVAH